MTNLEIQRMIRVVAETNPSEANRLRGLLEAKIAQRSTFTGRATRAQVRSNESMRMMEENLRLHMVQHHGA